VPWRCLCLSVEAALCEVYRGSVEKFSEKPKPAAS
jgi:hypothetical protein